MRTCFEDSRPFIAHKVMIPPCCPISGNPLNGSNLSVFYIASGIVMPVEDLASMVAEYIGGLGSVRGMEQMIQDIASRVSQTVCVPVRVKAKLLISPPFGGEQQTMRVSVSVRPHSKEQQP